MYTNNNSDSMMDIIQVRIKSGIRIFRIYRHPTSKHYMDIILKSQWQVFSGMYS